MNIIKPFLIALLLSTFIYMEYFDITIKLINTIFGLLGFYFLLTIRKKELFLVGFFLSNLWFWWIGYSFVHYDLSYLIPFVLLGIGIIYGLLFYFAGIIENIYYRIVYFFILSFMYPFGFNWLQLELPFINSYLGISKLDFALILLALLMIIKLKGLKKYLAIIPLLFSLDLNTQTISMPDIHITQANTAISQTIKWNQKYLKKIISINLTKIDNAIKNKSDLVILPETAFPLVLNKNLELLEILKIKSKSISIITGALHQENSFYHNSTYFFSNTNIKIAHKVVLIPFGEAVPLPELLRDIINNTFYNGAKDYEAAKQPTDFDIKGIKFRNAICYEATTNKLYENMTSKYMIAISNNAWFTPSIQPTLQNLLLKYYGKKYNIKIYSTANMSDGKIIN